VVWAGDSERIPHIQYLYEIGGLLDRNLRRGKRLGVMAAYSKHRSAATLVFS
jgi:hypothetical protein